MTCACLVSSRRRESNPEKYKESRGCHGDFGPACFDCAGVSDVLCDWPIAKGKTCDRGICEECAPPVAPDLHYCKSHRALWEQFKADELRGVVFAQFTGPNKPKRKPKDKRR